MNVWREVGRRFVVWLAMAGATVVAMSMAAHPLEHMSAAELFGFLAQAVAAGALLALSLCYFSVRLGDQRVSRALAGAMLLGPVLLPDHVWGRLGRVFGAFNPVVSSLLVMLCASVALNVGLRLADARGARGRRPS